MAAFIRPASRITVHHILTNSSGYPDIVFDSDGPTEDEALADWAADQGDVVLHAPPGVFFNYSNPNFNLAGLVAERASGIWEACPATNLKLREGPTPC